MKITPLEIANWREDATTQKMFEYFKKLREEAKEKLAEGTFTYPQTGATAQKIAGIIGTCQAYKEFLDISYEDFVQEYDLPTKEEERDVDSNAQHEDAAG